MKRPNLYLIGLAATLFGSYMTRAQSPGGVPATAWYRADAPTLYSDAGTTAVTDNAAVYQWNEYTGTGFHLLQASMGSRPVFSNATTLANFNPTVSFDGSNDWMQFTAGTGINIIDRENGTLYAAGFAQTPKQSGFLGFHASMDYPGLHIFSTDYKLLFFTGGPGYQGLSTEPFLAASSFTAGTGWQNGAGSSASFASATVSLNGTRFDYTGSELYNANLSTGARDLRIGADNNYGAFSGQLNEILVYENRLTSDQMDRVETYLAIKYGTTYAHGTENYISASGTAVWDATVNAGYHYNIAGIARDDAGALHQKQSWSTQAGKQVLISTTGLAGTNGANAVGLTNGQYLVWGDNGEKKAPSVPISTIPGINHHFAAVWRVENTGAVGTVRVAWPKGFSNLTLIQSPDATIDGSDAATDMSANEITVNGVVYNYADVTLSDGQYFTLGAFVQAPGGVVNGLTQWYRADKSVIAPGGDGSNVTSWTDFASGTVSAQIATAPLPFYKQGATNYFNFNPGIEFTEINQMIGNISEPTLQDVNFDIFTFTKEGMTGTRFFNIGMNNTSLGGANWDQPGLYANGNIASRNNSGGSLVITNPGSISFDPEIPSIMYHRFTDVNMSKGLNGAAPGTAYTFSSRGLTTGGHIFGANGGINPPNGDDWGFKGHIGEVIIYGDGNLTDEERNRVDAYLAIKYGITLDSNRHYLNSQGDTVWHATNNSDYYHNVAGIAHDNLSGLHQKQSISVNPGEQQVLIGTAGLANTNDSNTTGLLDGQYLVWGDNGLAKVPSVSISGVSGVNYRFASIWKVQNTGSTGTVRVAWPTGLTNLTLIKSTDPAFTTVAASYDMSGATITINGITYNYADVTLNDGDHFTFGAQLNGPGGVSLDLRVWLKSDAGFTPAEWTDFSGNSNNYTQTNATRQPFVAGQLYNFNPMVDFGTTGSDARFMVVPSGQPYSANGTNSTVFTASLSKDATGYTDILGFGNTTTGTGLTNANNPVITKMGDAVQMWPYSAPTSLPDMNINRLYLNDVSFTVGTSGIIYGQNGQLDTVTSTVTAGNALHANGSILGSQPEVRNGYIGEVIAYERNLTEDEKQRVRSYVAIKYGLTLPHDYVASNDTTVFWSIAANEGFNNNIAGIARDDYGSLNQRQSWSINTPREVLISTLGLNNSNAANTALLNDQQFLVWGDNGMAKSPSVSISDISGVNSRFASIWKVQNTGSVGTVRVAWRAGYANLKLIQSTDTVFNSSDIITDMSSVQVISGIEYAYADVTLADGQYFTFASFVQAPGGVTEGILMWHKANDGVIVPGAKNQWQDVSGNNRDVAQNNNPDYQPLLVTDAIYSADSREYFFNYNPFYHFDGSNDFFYNEGVTYFPSANSPGSVYGAMFNSAAGGWNTPYGWGDDDPNLVRAGNDYLMTRDNGTVLGINAGLNTLPVHIGGISWRGAANGVYLNVNGKIDSSASYNIGSIQSPVSNLNFAIGSEGIDLAGDGNEAYQGTISEVFAYSVDHEHSTGNEKERINSYLAIKYGITLRNESGTGAANYLSSASDTVWDALANAGYNNNIAGIAYDFLSALHQKQSRSVNANSNGQVIIGLGDIAATNVANPNALADGQFLLWGDNGNTQAMSAVAGTYTAFEYAGSIDNGRRMNRVWKVQNTGVGAEVLIRFPLASVGTTTLPDEACAQYVMVFADDSAFTTNVTVAPLTVNDDHYDVLHTFPDGLSYFTYARVRPINPGVVYLPAMTEVTDEYDGTCNTGDWTYFHLAGDATQKLFATSVFAPTELDSLTVTITTDGVTYEEPSRVTKLMPRITTVADSNVSLIGPGKVRIYFSQEEMDSTIVAGAVTNGWFRYEGNADEVIADIYGDGIFEDGKASLLIPDASGVEDGVSYVEFHNIDSFSSFVFLSSTEDESTVLPVSLLYFTAAEQDGDVLLDWATATEQHCSGFEIERSADGRNWSKIGFEGSKSEDGNSNTRLNYNYLDANPLIGANYYRLKQAALDGTFEYSTVSMVNLNQKGGIVVMPNPTKGLLTVKGLTKGKHTVMLINAIGQILSRTEVSGVTTYRVDLSRFIPGIYFISVVSDNGDISSHKIIKE